MTVVVKPLSMKEKMVCGKEQAIIKHITHGLKYLDGVRLSLGRFNSFYDAKLTWAKAKANFIDEVIENNNFKSPVVDGLLKLKNDLLNLNNLNRGFK